MPSCARAHRRRPDGTTLLDALPVRSRSRRATTRCRGPSTVDDPPRWWPRRARRAAAVRRSMSRVEVAGAAERRRPCARRFARSGCATGSCSVNGERLFLMGSNHGPTRMALADATVAELARDVVLARSTRTSTCCASTRTSPGRSSTTPPTSRPAALAGPPAAVGLRPGRTQAGGRARRARWSTCSGHHPSIVLWCAHNEPLAVDASPASRRSRGVAANWRRDVPPDVEQGRARPLHRACPAQADRTRRSTRTRASCPASASAGTDTHLYFGWYHGDLDGLARTSRRCAAPRPRFVSEFGAQAVPTTADFMQPERWPDLDWDDLSRAPRVAEARLRPATCHPPTPNRSTRGATRPRPTRPRCSSCRSRTCAGSSTTRPAGSATSASPTGIRR